MTAEIVRLPQPSPGRLECSACGATQHANCDCGVPYVPAGARAAAAVKANPEKSDRAIAAELGVSAPTVSKARRATVKDFTVTPPVKRVGKDGKARKLPTKRAPAAPILPPRGDVGPDSGGEVARKLARLDELENATRRLERENLALRSEVDELRTAFADPIQEPCPDCDTQEQSWQFSFGNLAGDAIAMRPYWTRLFGKWEQFEKPSHLATLAKQAARAWTELAEFLDEAAS